ncbi:MAG: M48 family metalloprotease [Fimbriimonadales bacterium]
MLCWLWIGSSVLVAALGLRLVSSLSAGERSFGRALRAIKRLFLFSVSVKATAAFGVFSLGGAYSEPVWAGLILVAMGLLLGEFGLIFWRLYPLERRHRGVEIGIWDYVAMRLGLIFELLAPLVAGGLMILSITYTLRGGYREHGSLGILLAGLMGTGGVGMGVLFFRRRLILPVRPLTLPESLMGEVRRMGRELGITVRDVVVLDGRRVRMANAFALSGGRIAITDYLLAHLEPREVLAVLAHEVAHLAQRRRLVRLWAYLLGAAVGLTVGLAPLWERFPNWVGILLMGLLGFGMSLPLVLMRARNEREADTYAVSEYGTEALRSALIKMARLNHREAQEQTDRLHPSLQERLRLIERFEGR